MHYNISKINYKTPALYLAAVQNTGRALQYVPTEYQTLDLCLIAIRHMACAIDHVRNELTKIILSNIQG